MNPIDKLSDYFADAILEKMRMKSEEQLLWAKIRISVYKKYHDVLQALIHTRKDRDASNDELIKRAKEDVSSHLLSVAGDWDYDELHMQCLHAAFIPKSSPVNWFLFYRIQTSQLTMFFNCQIGEDGIFNYQLKCIGVEPDKVWDYYIVRTPCAVV